MKTLFSALLVVALFIYSAVTAFASPAYPGLIKKVQPDGTVISLYLKGDEKIHWMESEDGYSLLYDSNRNIVYAIADKEGNMVPSSVVARDISSRSASDQTFLKEIPQKLNYSPVQINTAKSIWKMVQKSSNPESNQLRATAKTAKAICTLINFSDKSITISKAAFNNLMNQVGYSAEGDNGSVHDYYIENSYGQVDLEITVAGPYTLSQPWAYYGANDPSTGSDNIDKVHQFATEAANLTFGGNNPTINPADYDNGSGSIGGFHIIYAGYGEEAGGDPNCIWAHESGFYPALTFGGEQLKTYSCSAELRGNSGTNITHIGVICHEMGHVLGAPDFYDVNGTGAATDFLGTGNWDLMASGNWNNGGACPAHINMYQKIQFGWVNPTVLTQAQAITGMPNSETNAVAYRYDTSTSGEYFVLENRQKTGFDQYIPGTGLLIYHVSITNADINNNTVNIASPQKVYPVCASATTNPTATAASYGSINTAGCPFPGTSNKTSFTDYSIPAATSWKGNNTLKPVTEIQQQNGVISFNFLMPNANPVTNLKAAPFGQSVQLTWTKPSDDVIGYNVYRNNTLLIKLTQPDSTSYTQYNVAAGTYSYCVTACYPGKESAPVCQEVSISKSSINGNSYTVKNLTAQNVNGNKDIQINWQSPFVSDWVSHATNTNYVLNGGTNPFTSVSRFMTDDLQNFYGSQLTKVRFWVDTAQCKYTIQVWLQDPGLTSLPDTPIVSQVVNNPTLGSENVITLNTPVPLVNNKELWIGIQYQMTNPKAYVAGFDGDSPSMGDPASMSQRNWIIQDQWYYIGQSDSINWDISGYLQFDNTFLNAPATTTNAWLRSSTATTATPTSYVVYRDGVKIATTTKSQYIDTLMSSGTHIYCISIAYDDGSESEQACVEAFSTQVQGAVTVLQATVSDQSVHLTWNKPSNDVIGYNIYRNNTLLIKLSDQDSTSFVQYNVAAGTYSYCVTACYPEKESTSVCQEVTIAKSSINGNSYIVKNLTAQNVNGDKDIQLNWQSPFVSDWVTHAENIYYVFSGGANPFTSVSRFMTDDLQNFYGSQLTKVRFWVDTAQCKYTIQVWLQNPGLTSLPGTPTVSQTVNNPTLGSENVVTLNTPVPLANNKELWIGIQYQPTNPKSYVAGFDGDSPSMGDDVSNTQRNWIYIDKWYYIGQSDSINWAISGYLQFDNTFLNAPATTNAWLRSSTATTATPTNYVVYRDDNVKIATTTKTQYVDTQPPYGNHIYRVAIAFDDGSESEQACVEAFSSNYTALEQVNNPEGDINIFPNPVKKGETLSINCDASISSTLLLYTISGQLLQKEQITGPVYQKKMDFDPGVYLLKINSNSKSFVRRIIIR